MKAFKKTRRLWRWLIGIGVTLVVIALGLVGYAFRLPSKQQRVIAPDMKTGAMSPEQSAEILAEFLAVQSYSYHDRSKMDPDAFLRLHQILQDRFPNAHQSLQRETVSELSLLYRWQGTDESLDPILLMSHMDVVPVSEETASEWIHGYQTGEVADGYVWGRGALDVKSGVIAIMSAVEQLASDGFTPQRTVYLAFGHDEEIGGEQGNAVMAKRFADQGIRFAYILDEGGAILDGVVPGAPRPVAFVAIAEKAWADLEIVAHGEGGHGSMPGRSAVAQLSETIRRIENQPMPVRVTEATATLFRFLAPEMPLLQRTVLGNRWLFDGLIGWQFSRQPSTEGVVRSTMNVTQLFTRNPPNVTPAWAKATVNVRLLPGDTAEDARDHLLAITKDQQLHDGSPAIECTIRQDIKGQLVSSDECEEFATLQKTIHEVFPDVIVAAGLTSVSTDSSWYYGVTDKIYRFIPMRVRSEDMARIHGVNERLAVDNLAEIVRFYELLLRNSTAENGIGD
ncbi:M20/M25/M40 family metallo-hydrolase [Roseiconus nitratireducens]|uniref:M20/M25/M40 family metallo-hydrolase n=1 Tax=Roseiconus nitratireducens TaxID=2605748 RepID=A0A5M6D2Y3_9BACT|nr:M20/M25/M40 family metallo-hydrolase [Roseiconus nitratireducens]KAA5541831.1 M20/M25/M40 family metallo-hydrolase [Roseiconus nitratireducens]